jgi:hypothetical protein
MLTNNQNKNKKFQSKNKLNRERSPEIAQAICPIRFFIMAGDFLVTAALLLVVLNIIYR